MANDCLFCKIINKEIPKTFVYEDQEVVAFLDIHPVNPGHTLIVPKKHSADIFDTDDHLLGDIAVAAKKIGQALKKSFGVEGVNLEVNNGKDAGQIINHAHWHVVPRRPDDGLKNWPGGSYAEGEEQQIAEKIKGSIN